MSVGAEGESGIVVAQHTADGFDVYAILEGYCGEGVPEAMQRDVLKISIFKNLFMELCYGVWVVHLSRSWGWEHVLVIGMLVVFLDQEVYRFFRDGHFADRGFSLGTGEGQFSIGVTDILFADEDRAILYIQVRPEESNQLTFAEATD